MRILKITAAVLALFLACALSGCGNASAILRENTERCTPLAERWFAENLPGAEDISIEPADFGREEYSCDIVTGTYSRNGRSYGYHLNVDTGEFNSEEYYEALYGAMEDIIADCLSGIPGPGYTLLHFPLEPSVIHGRAAAGRGQAPYEVSRKCSLSYEMIPSDRLEALALEKLSGDSCEIYIALENVEMILGDISVLSFLEEYPGWTLMFQEGEDAELNYEAYYQDGEIRIYQEMIDSRGIRWYIDWLRAEEGAALS